MSEPIISPLAVYLITRLDFIYAVAWLIFGVSIMVVVASLADEQSLRKCAIVVACIAGAVILLLPTSKEAMMIYAASRITPQVIQSTGDTVDKAIDRVVEKIMEKRK